jgi:hypothetical protein
MNTYTVQYSSAVVPDWDKVEKAELAHALWLPRPEGLSVYGQICYDQDNFKVRLAADESEPLARSEGLTDYVHIDSALELFISPLPGDGRYFNFEFNALGTIYLGFGFDRHRSARLLIPDYRTRFSVAPFRTPGLWGVTLNIPVSFIRIFLPSFEMEKGMILRGNIYKCGDETETPHYLAWNSVDSEAPDFHRPECFGEFCLQ